MKNNCRKWTRQDKLSQINLATLDHYYALLSTAERKRDQRNRRQDKYRLKDGARREWLPEFVLVIKIIESICRLEGIDVDYARIDLAWESQDS
tara:strand:+ start:6594 stop:6872 length:279 start_codon:yes stop_codon:yes gene_type:complete